MADRTWETEERPLLEAYRRAEVEGRPMTTVTADQAGLSLELYQRVLPTLSESRHLDGRAIRSDQGPSVMMVRTLTEKGRRAIGQWPSDDAVTELVALLKDRIAREDDPTLKQKLQRLLDSLQDVNKVVAGGLLVQLLANVTHLH